MEQGPDSDHIKNIVDSVRESALVSGMFEMPVDWSPQSQYVCVDTTFKTLRSLSPAELPDAIEALLTAFAPPDTANNESLRDVDLNPTDKVIYRFLSRLTEKPRYREPSQEIERLRDTYFASKQAELESPDQ